MVLRRVEHHFRKRKLFRLAYDGHAIARDEDHVRTGIRNDAAGPGNGHHRDPDRFPKRRIGNTAARQRTVVRHGNPSDLQIVRGGDQIPKHTRTVQARPLGLVDPFAPDDVRVPLNLANREMQFQQGAPDDFDAAFELRADDLSRALCTQPSRAVPRRGARNDVEIRRQEARGVHDGEGRRVVRQRDHERARLRERGVLENVGVAGFSVQHRDTELVKLVDSDRIGLNHDSGDLEARERLGDVPADPTASDDHDVIDEVFRRR